MILLLQNEDLVVRDAAAEVIQVAQLKKKSNEGTGTLMLLLNIFEFLGGKSISLLITNFLLTVKCFIYLP